MVDQFEQCRVQAPVAGGSGLMSGASWTGTLLGFGVLGGSVVGFGRNKRRVTWCSRYTQDNKDNACKACARC